MRVMKIESEVGKVLRKRQITLAVAESCTGGLISSRITDSSGSSDYFIMGIVAYSNQVKENILGVSRRLLQKHGAVSKQVALEMAKGVRLLANTDIGIGVTGIAGPKPLTPSELGFGASPTGGTKSKPVGLVYIALVTDKKRIVKEFRFKGSRLKIKSQAAQAALQLLSF
jgi:PncC family amidohydrolase